MGKRSNFSTRRIQTAIFAAVVACISIFSNSISFAAGTYSNLAYTSKPKMSEFSWWYNWTSFKENI